MGKKISDIKIQKQNFLQHKRPFAIKDININKIVISK